MKARAGLRKNSYHAALRTTVTKRRDHQHQGDITITLKLFNGIARDCGRALLARAEKTIALIIKEAAND